MAGRQMTLSGKHTLRAVVLSSGPGTLYLVLPVALPCCRCLQTHGMYKEKGQG